MSDFEKNTTGEFTAETEAGGRPLFNASKVRLTEGFRPDPGPYWQGLGEQVISESPRLQYAWLSVYVPKDADTGDHDLGVGDSRYRASYAFGDQANSTSYFSTTGKMTLTVVPSVDNPRLEGTIEFVGKTLSGEKTVDVKKGVFKFSGLTKDLSGTPDKE
jgi:hypothetical protein